MRTVSPYDPMRDWPDLMKQVQDMAAGLANLGKPALKRIEIDGHMYPSMTIETASGPVLVRFTEWEEARAKLEASIAADRVHGL